MWVNSCSLLDIPNTWNKDGATGILNMYAIKIIPILQTSMVNPIEALCIIVAIIVMEQPFDVTIALYMSSRGLNPITTPTATSGSTSTSTSMYTPKAYGRVPNKSKVAMSFQELVSRLQWFWSKAGCILTQPIDIEVGAGTSHPMCFLSSIGPEPAAIAYTQSSRRPSDGRYGSPTYRLQHYYQFQVIIKPNPKDIQEAYIRSIESLGIGLRYNDLRFVEDNWENPTLATWGIGWEVWLNGMEVTQVTYFQHVGGLPSNPTTTEVAYGLERLAMHMQGVNNVYSISWSKGLFGSVSYGDMFLKREVSLSTYNFDYAGLRLLFSLFENHIKEVQKGLLFAKVLLEAVYEYVLKAIHMFNLLEARNVLSDTERKSHIMRIRSLSKDLSKKYFIYRKTIGFPKRGIA